MQGHINKLRETDFEPWGFSVRPRWHRQQTVTFGAWQGLYGVGEKAVKPRWQVPGGRCAGCPVSVLAAGCQVSAVQPTGWNFQPSKRLTAMESLSRYGRTSFWSGESRPLSNPVCRVLFGNNSKAV
jgi:hypothetical protein